MLPGFRAVIAGILATIVLPMVAFGIAGSFRAANGTAFNPTIATATGPALIEYYWSQFYAPAVSHPDEARAEAEAKEAAAVSRHAALLDETFKMFDVPPAVSMPSLPVHSAAPQSAPPQ